MIALGAVFLALALGILIGISFGDNFLVANQRDIIGLMEAQLARLEERARQQGVELQRWEALKPLLWRGLAGALEGKVIVLLSSDPPAAEQTGALLRDSGARVIRIGLPGAGIEPGGTPRPFPAAAELAALLTAAEAPGAESMAALGLEMAAEEAGSCAWPPHFCLLQFDGEAPSPGSLFQELWRELHEREVGVIALFPWSEKSGAAHLTGLKPEPSLVDNIDTFWGRFALIKMLAEGGSGHYGFGRGSAGLFPGAEQNE